MEISGYKIIKSLGEGGMATVHLATQESVNRYVALKVMLPELLEDPDNSRRFLREARIAARFRHPNIIAIYDVSLEKGRPYIAMEYVPGGKLDTDRIKSMSLTEKLAVVVQCADAISFLHGQNYIHRDIKPSNILFREDGTIVLTDFGVAHDGSADTKITRTGFIIGTPHYMSPEQARGIELDARADIYSLGVLLFRMLAGHVPFTADHPVTVCTMHMNAPIPDLPEELSRFDPVVKKAMAKQREDRYSSANEFIDAVIAVTGSDTSQFLQRQVGTTLEEVKPSDTTSPSQLQRAFGGHLETRIEPTISEPGTVRQPSPAPAVNETPRPKRKRSSSESRRRSGRKKSKSRSAVPAIAGAGVAGLALAGVLVFFGPDLWDKITGEGSARDQSFTVQFESAERLIADGSRGSLVRAGNQYSRILSRDPQNERARQGREEVDRLLAELNAAAQPKDSAPAPVQQPAPVEQAPAEPIDPNQETIDRLLALGSQYASTPLSLNEGVSPSQPYREVLKLDPRNQQATLGLIGLAESMMTLAEFSMADGDLETTGWLIDEIARTGIRSTDRLASLKDKYAELSAPPEPEPEPEVDPNLEEIMAALERGFAYLEQDQLSRPEDANAIAEFNRVLALDSQNAEARSGLQMVAQRYLVLAEGEIDKGNGSRAERFLGQANALAPGLEGADAIQADVDRLKSTQTTQAPRSNASGVPPDTFPAYSFGNLGVMGNESASDLFMMAETELNKGNDLQAYGLYREILRRDPGNSGALRRLNRGAGAFLRFAGRDISEGNLSSAYNNLVIALTLDADHPRADSTRRSYLSARQAKYASSTGAGSPSNDLVQNMRLDLYFKNAQSSHNEFTSDPSNQAAATRAIEQYAEVLAIDPDHQPARQGLARLCDELIDASVRAIGRSERNQALWFYNAAHSIDPQNPRLTALEAQLRSSGP